MHATACSGPVLERPDRVLPERIVNVNAHQYFSLTAPAGVIALGMVLVACWWVQRRSRSARFLLWVAAGYVLPSLAMGLQSLMSNAQLSQWSLFTAVLYLAGLWCLAQGMALRAGIGSISWQAGAVISAATLAGLYYHSRMHDDLWARMQWLNLGVGALLLLPARRLWRARLPADRLERLLHWSFLGLAAYHVLRAATAALLVPADGPIVLTHSGYWLAMLAGSLLFAIWFSVLLLACSMRTVYMSMRDERNRDPLTRLLNRRGFEEAADALLGNGRSGPWVAVVGDIDHFKRVNDRCGHACGDQVLQAVSELLMQQVREQDLVARFGGEEFVLLLGRVQLPEAEKVVQRIREQLRAMPLAMLPPDMRITMSFGIAAVQTRQSLRASLDEADVLSYAAKQAGRDRIHLQAFA